MPNCKDETVSLHHQAKRSLGPIGDSERIVFALFSGSIRYGTRLDPKDFSTERLNKGQESVARFCFSSKRTFERGVAPVDGSGPRKLSGVSFAFVENVRSVPFKSTSQPPVTGFAFCVLDRVESGDDDAHGTLAFSDAMQALPTPQLMKLKPLLRLDLTKAFGEIADPRKIRWRWHIPVLFAKAKARRAWARL